MTEIRAVYPNIQETEGIFTTCVNYGYDSGGPTTQQHKTIAELLTIDPRGLGDRFNTLRILPKGDEVIITGQDRKAVDMTAFAYAQLPGVLRDRGGWTSHGIMTFRVD